MAQQGRAGINKAYQACLSLARLSRAYHDLARLSPAGQGSAMLSRLSRTSQGVLQGLRRDYPVLTRLTR
eukprot:7426437-Pyramimonas_sp.AAC.1